MRVGSDTGRRADGRGIRGGLGETLAAAWLQLCGWELIARDVRLAGVQVDLVARRGRTDALVEVKTRSGHDEGPPVELRWLVSAGQLRRLERAARAWASLHPQLVRVDVLEVRLGRPWPRFRRLEDVLR
jgi:putative endonuclease